MDEYDYLIKDARIVDGSGKQPYKGSIGIISDRVAAVGDVKGDSKTEIDAQKLTAVPGFIDCHSHADVNLRFFPKCESYLLQGITTFIGGNCGVAPAPLGDVITLPSDYAQIYLGELTRFKYYPNQTRFPREQVNSIMKEKFGWTVDWRSMAEFFQAVEDVGISCNYVPLVGHGACRKVVLGEDSRRPSKPDELEEIKALVRECMDDGCRGVTVGLDYDPGVFADRMELVECVAIAKDYGGVFSPHARRTGLRRGMAAGHRLPKRIDAIIEVIDICRAAGVRMNIAHLFTGWDISPAGGPSVLEEANRRATLQVIDEANEEGLDVSFDAMPMAALPEGLHGWSYLTDLLEPWVRELGSRASFAEWLKAPDFREDVKGAIKAGRWFIRVAYNPNTNPRWAENITVLEHRNPGCVNKTIQRIAEERNTEPFDTWLDLIVEDPDAKEGLGFAGEDRGDASYQTIFFEHPACAVGLDAWGVDYDSMHPPVRRSGREMMDYAAFVGFYEKWVKQTQTFTLVEAVHKTSTQAANRYNLEGRGVIKEGGYADILLMDYASLKVNGTPLEPRRQPSGIEYVFVNGVPVVEKARHTGVRPGRILKRA
ncbi:amidohydrolase family protein [Candidatus Bathyarchaeota archaeon]|nr:amidohydrolase family protein [Candidatus Bathyarchaeota archaeon]